MPSNLYLSFLFPTVLISNLISSQIFYLCMSYHTFRRELCSYFTQKTETLQGNFLYFPIAMHIHQNPLVSSLSLSPATANLPICPREPALLTFSHMALQQLPFYVIQHHISSTQANMLIHVLSQTNTRKPFPFSHCPISLHPFTKNAWKQCQFSLPLFSPLPAPQGPLRSCFHSHPSM